MSTVVFRQILPFSLIFALLILSALLIDYILHFFGLTNLDYFFGFVGAGLILLSFIYSLRKRRIIKWGSPKKLLLIHEYLSWIGALFLLIHAGIHFNALLAWIAAIAMLIAVISGLTGKYILKRAENIVAGKRKMLIDVSPEESERKLFFDSLAVDIMKKWRHIHIPITSVFFILALMHIIITSIFGLW